jgi:hypothetical protein
VIGWTRLEDDRHVYGALVDGDVVRVDFGDHEPDACCLAAALATVRQAQETLAGHCVTQVSIGAPSTPFARLVEASIDELEARAG